MPVPAEAAQIVECEENNQRPKDDRDSQRDFFSNLEEPDEAEHCDDHKRNKGDAHQDLRVRRKVRKWRDTFSFRSAEEKFKCGKVTTLAAIFQNPPRNADQCCNNRNDD